MTATLATEEKTDLEALARMIPRTITPPLRAWLLEHGDDPEITPLLTACVEAEERLTATRQRFDHLADLMATNDDALAAATDANRAKVVADRALHLAEREGMPEAIRRHAEAKALAALRLLRAIRRAALADQHRVFDEAEPLRVELRKLHSERVRNQGIPKPHRMTAEEVVEHQGKINDLATNVKPIESRQTRAGDAHRGALLAADRLFGDHVRGMTINLDVASEKAWDRVVSHYAARYLTETLGAQPLRLVA